MHKDNEESLKKHKKSLIGGLIAVFKYLNRGTEKKKKKKKKDKLRSSRKCTAKRGKGHKVEERKF